MNDLPELYCADLQFFKNIDLRKTWIFNVSYVDSEQQSHVAMGPHLLLK